MEKALKKVRRRMHGMLEKAEDLAPGDAEREVSSEDRAEGERLRLLARGGLMAIAMVRAELILLGTVL